MNPCENDYKSYLRIGNFNENSIKEAWNSKFYKKLRKDHISKKETNILLVIGALLFKKCLKKIYLAFKFLDRKF